MKIFLVAVAATIFAVRASATTCVANEAFKVRQVCGIVVATSGALITQVPVELQNRDSVPLEQVETNANGEFAFVNVSDGKYILRVTFNGFASAWQPFVVTHSKRVENCRHPIQVSLDVAGRCSSVSPSR